MKKYRFLLLAIIASVMVTGCDFLEVDPQGMMGEDDIRTPDKIESAVNSAYAALGNDNMNTPFSLWYLGNVRARLFIG